jgi:hypothetical protein
MLNPQGHRNLTRTVSHSGVLGFWTLFMARYSKEHNFSEVSSFRPQVSGWETQDLLGPLERVNPNHGLNGVSPAPSPEDGKTYSFRNIVFFRIPDDEQSPKTQ